jgi:hypothetical protein
MNRDFDQGYVLTELSMEELASSYGSGQSGYRRLTAIEQHV